MTAPDSPRPATTSGAEWKGATKGITGSSPAVASDPPLQARPTDNVDANSGSSGTAER
jgi:hypothetical protein